MKRVVNDKVVLAGYVSKVERKNENLVNVSMNVSTKKDNPDWVTISVWNNDKVKTADTVEKYIIKGSYFVAVVTEKQNGEFTNYTSYRVILFGTGVVDLGEGKSLVVGRVSKVERKSEKFVVVGINASSKKDETDWKNVAIWNSEKVAFADNAEKYLVSGQTLITVVTEKENGEYKNLSADAVEYGPKPQKKTEE